jgi:nicotinamide-nucleotide amidase
MAEGIRIRTGADIGLAVTGIAGPTGATESKPAGLVYIALSDGNTTECIEKNFRGDRTRVREFATQQALDLIRKRLM